MPAQLPSPLAFLLAALVPLLGADMVLYGLARSRSATRFAVGRGFLFSGYLWPLGMLFFGGGGGALLGFVVNLTMVLIQPRNASRLAVRTIVMVACLLSWFSCLGAANPQARIVFDRTNVQSIARSIGEYRVQYGTWPISLGQLAASAPRDQEFFTSPGGFGQHSCFGAGPFMLFPVRIPTPTSVQLATPDYLYSAPSGGPATEIMLATRPGRLWNNAINVAYANGIAVTYAEEEWVDNPKIRGFFWKTRTRVDRNLSGLGMQAPPMPVQ